MPNAPTPLENGQGTVMMLADSLPVVRNAVRDLLLASRSYQSLPEEERVELARAMVTVCHRAAELLKEEIKSDATYRQVAATQQSAPEQPSETAQTKKPLARAQADFGEAAGRVAKITHDVLNAVSFPRFVTELITGVFKAMVDSSQQQMHSFVELLRNVSATTDGFADANMGPDRARSWLAQQYPGSFELVEGEGDDSWGDEAGGAPRPAPMKLALRAGGQWPPAAAVRTDLGLAQNESVPTGDPEVTLVPLARRLLAQQRQQMLASMVLMGLQRIVIESGRIHASMRFHIDTRSALQQDRGSSFDFRNSISAAGSFGAGPWGVSASVQNTIGYVSTERTQSTEEINTSVDLNSAVEIVFRTDHVPLEVLAGKEARERIKVNTLNPDAELKEYNAAQAARDTARGASDTARRGSLDTALKPPTSEAPKLPEVPKPMPERDSSMTPAPAPGAPAPATPAPATPAPATPAPAMPVPANQPAEKKASKTGPGAKATAFASPVRETWPLRPPDVVFVPTPLPAVEEMLKLADLKPTDTLYDLGCGDGRIVITAAQKYGCRAIGFDIDPKRINESRANVDRAKVKDLVEIRHQDLFTVDLSEADVVTLYLLPDLNRKLLPQLRHLKPGARIISHDFSLGDIPPERMAQAHYPDRNTFRTFYRWTAPLPPSLPEPVPRPLAARQDLVLA